MSTPFNITLRSFESKVLYFNGMYKLPVGPYPTVFAVVADERRKNPGLDLTQQDTDKEYLIERLVGFKKTLSDELDEMDDIIHKLRIHVPAGEQGYAPIDCLVDLADLFGDIQVYCASEMVKFGLPVDAVLQIIMNSNFSKLQVDGTAQYDANGKVQKGPMYWKPEPQIRELLESIIQEKQK